MKKEIDCPACDSVIILDGDENVGDEVFCAYCGAPYTLSRSDDDTTDFTVEEDW